MKVPYPPLKQDSNKASVNKKKCPPSEPHYSILHSGEFTMQDFTNDRESSQIKRPKKLVVSIELPGVKSASAVNLDIFEKRLTLECTNPTYKLDVSYLTCKAQCFAYFRRGVIFYSCKCPPC